MTDAVAFPEPFPSDPGTDEGSGPGVPPAHGLLEGLNPMQLEAVLHTSGPLLIRAMRSESRIASSTSCVTMKIVAPTVLHMRISSS